MRSSRTSTATVLALLSGCALLFGCTTATHLQTLPRQTETTISPTGEPSKYIVEVISLSHEFTTKMDRLPVFLVSITNNAQSPVQVSAANITASSGHQPVQIYDPSELSKLLRNDAKMKIFVAGARSTTQIEAAENAHPSSGGPPVMPVRTNAASEFDSARKEASTELTRATGLLFPYLLPPAATVTGTIELHAEDIAPDQPLTLTVTLGTEKHTFVFDVRS